MRVCTCCKIKKPIDKFYTRYNKSGKTETSRCKSCIKSEVKIWRKNPTGRVKWRAYNERRVSFNKEFLRKEREKGCRKCGENRHYVIDFHHLDPGEKIFTIGRTNQWTLTQLKKEIRKCILLCKNCHQELHFLEKNNKKFKINKWLNEKTSNSQS